MTENVKHTQGPQHIEEDAMVTPTERQHACLACGAVWSGDAPHACFYDRRDAEVYDAAISAGLPQVVAAVLVAAERARRCDDLHRSAPGRRGGPRRRRTRKTKGGGSVSPTEHADLDLLPPGCPMRVFPDGVSEFCVACDKSHDYVWLQTPLVAAAPDLLVSLKDALMYIDATPHRPQRFVTRLRRAVAKAEGREAGA